MQKKRLGKSDIFVSQLTLGCMSLGANQASAAEVIHHAIDCGINHLDTADLYDFGENEKLIGEIIKYRREEIIITTKVGNHFNRNQKEWYWDPSNTYIEKAVQDSLQRLQTDYIDLYLLHGGTIEDPIDEVIETFEKLKKRGIIRAYGVSSIRPNVIKEYVKKSNMDAVMMQYSMLDRRPEELLNMLHQNDISVLARGPLAKGILSKQALDYVLKKASKGYINYRRIELEETVKQLCQLREPLGKLAFQYVLHHPVVTSAVFGARTMEQLQENLSFIPLNNMNDDLYHHIQHITKLQKYISHR